jgi:hypothetical protein
MGWCVLWAGASYGPARLMDRCVLWAEKYDNKLTLIVLNKNADNNAFTPDVS